MGLVGGGGVSGVCHSIAVARIHFPAANQRRDEIMASVGSRLAIKDRKNDILLYVQQQNYCQRRSSGHVVYNFC